MDLRLRELERRSRVGDFAAFNQLLSSLLRTATIEEWRQRAAGGDAYAIEYLPALQSFLYPTSADEELWVNVFARWYDRDLAVASFSVSDEKTAAVVAAWAQKYFDENQQLLPSPLTRLIIKTENGSNFDLEEGEPTYELLHVWDPEYREPRVAFTIIESYDIQDDEQDSDEEDEQEEDEYSLLDREGDRWLNSYSLAGSNRRYSDGSVGWAHWRTPLATIYMGHLPPNRQRRRGRDNTAHGMLDEPVWYWEPGTAQDRCDQCDFVNVRPQDEGPTRYCPVCESELYEEYDTPPRLVSNDAEQPIPQHINDALNFVDRLYDRHRNRPWALNSALPGQDITHSLWTTSAKAGWG